MPITRNTFFFGEPSVEDLEAKVLLEPSEISDSLVLLAIACSI